MQQAVRAWLPTALAPPAVSLLARGSALRRALPRVCAHARGDPPVGPGAPSRASYGGIITIPMRRQGAVRVHVTYTRGTTGGADGQQHWGA